MLFRSGLTFLPPEAKYQNWLTFVYGALITGIVLLVWDYIYHHRLLRVVDTSIIIWTGIASVYLTLLVILNINQPLLFVIGVPLEILEILWFLFRRNKKKTGNK